MRGLPIVDAALASIIIPGVTDPQDTIYTHQLPLTRWVTKTALRYAEVLIHATITVVVFAITGHRVSRAFYL